MAPCSFHGKNLLRNTFFFFKSVGEYSYGTLFCRGQLKCDGTRAETTFRLSAKRTSPYKSARASVQSTAGSRGVRISGNNAGYTMFRDSVKGTGYPLHSPVSPSLPLPCVTLCHHISTGVYYEATVTLFHSLTSSTQTTIFALYKFHISSRYTTQLGRSHCAIQSVGLRPLACWDCGFVCPSLVSVVCCQADGGASG